MSTPEETLKPCPFCGADAMVDPDDGMIRCSGEPCHVDELLPQFWQRRPGEDVLREQRDEARAGRARASVSVAMSRAARALRQGEGDE